MSSVADYTFRELDSGMGHAVAKRTILRMDDNGRYETWEDVARRVAAGNASIVSSAGTADHPYDSSYEQDVLTSLIGKGIMLTSGRHLQHGDAAQPGRNQEIFTNCSTAATTFMLFYLLLNGSGVGRSYDDDMMLVDWDNAPTLRCVLSDSHPDFDYSAHESVRQAKHKYGTGRDVMWFEVPDSREGWARAVEIWESAAFEKIHRDKTLVLDFSKVRSKGSPIGGMQDRPASGPVPLMNAFAKAASLRGAGLSPWLQAMYIDHYFAECVLVGGARRAARIATKHWKDESIFDFIQVKRPVEYIGKKFGDVIRIKEETIEKTGFAPQNFLWSSNNSVIADQEYWDLLAIKRGSPEYSTDDAKHARKVHKMLTECAYADGTGEPGILNAHKFTSKEEGLDFYKKNLDSWIGSKKYQTREDTGLYLKKLVRRVIKKTYKFIANPCGEVSLFLLGGFCVIGDVAPYHADTLSEAEDAIRAMVRFLIRINLMDSTYNQEVRRTNRIGVSLTGVHEYAWKFFGLTFNDLVDEQKSQEFWQSLARFNKAAKDEAEKYVAFLNNVVDAEKIFGFKVLVPHTITTVKPAGTTSKLFGLTEGWHLPSMKFFLRNVQFRTDDPLVEQYRKQGYPVRDLKSYEGTSIVGFPTAPAITQIMPAEKIVTAAEATMQDQYQWLRLGEKYWINGLDESGNEIESGSDENYGNQISYTLKYDPDKLDYRTFEKTFKEFQSKIKCCSVMPQINTDKLAVEYLPEEPTTKARFEQIHNNIQHEIAEDIDFEHLDCSSGGCPVDFNK